MRPPTFHAESPHQPSLSIVEPSRLNARTPHPANVPGDFYVEDGCCTSCGVMHTEGADLLGWAADDHCHVRKQPETPAELSRMFDAIAVAEMDCIRYKGSNRVIQIRLVDASAAAQCDRLPADLAAMARDPSTAAHRHHLASNAGTPAADPTNRTVVGTSRTG